MDNKLLESFSQLDTDLIERSETANAPRRVRRVLWSGLAAAAAVAAVAVALVMPDLDLGGSRRELFENYAPDPMEGDPADPAAPGSASGPASEPGTSQGAQNNGDPGDPGAEDPTTLIFNAGTASGAVPPEAFFRITDTPMSAAQLELVWSVDSPTAYLEEGEEERWLYGSNLRGAARYWPDGSLYCLSLAYTIREERESGPFVRRITVLVSPAGEPLYLGCIPPEDPVTSQIGPMECVACRYDLPDKVRLTAQFTIGETLYTVLDDSPADGSGVEEGEFYVYYTVAGLQKNYLDGVRPDLSTFVKDDPQSGELARD